MRMAPSAYRRYDTTGMRVGIGYDIHRLEAGRSLLLGGVPIPSDRGATGHSDADALLHAVIDALLGAAGLGDIGGHFPSSDPRWQGADSAGLLRLVAAEVAAAGWTVENLDANVILEQPRLAAHIMEMRTRVAETLAVEVERISVKAKTNERLGPVGEGEAVAAEAIVLLRRR